MTEQQPGPLSSLLSRLRPDVEAAPWVIAELTKINAELSRVQALVDGLDSAYKEAMESLRVAVDERDQLQAENEALRDSVAAKADRIDRLGEMIERLQAGGQGVVPASEVTAAIEAWKSAWIRVPTFADRVNKATREAITASHGPLFILASKAQQAATHPPAAPALVPLTPGQIIAAMTEGFPHPSLVPMLKGSVICGDFHKALVAAVNVAIAEFCRINGLTVGGDGGAV